MSNINFFQKGLWIPVKTFLILIIICLIGLTIFGVVSLRSVYSTETEDKYQSLKNQKIILQDEQVSESEKEAIDSWLEKENLNQYGDPRGTNYVKNPLKDTLSGEVRDRYAYLKERFPSSPWQN